MIRSYRIALLIILAAATLACGLISNPVNNVRNAAETAQALASAVPLGTLEAFPSAFPSLEALGSALPPIEGLFDPTGEPVGVWNEVPIMPEATAGNEVGTNYSFRAPVSAGEVRSFYEGQLAALGWEQMMSLPGSGELTVLLFTKDDRILTVTATGQGDEVIVVLGLQ